MCENSEFKGCTSGVAGEDIPIIDCANTIAKISLRNFHGSIDIINTSSKEEEKDVRSKNAQNFM